MICSHKILISKGFLHIWLVKSPFFPPKMARFGLGRAPAAGHPCPTPPPRCGSDPGRCRAHGGLAGKIWKKLWISMTNLGNSGKHPGKISWKIWENLDIWQTILKHLGKIGKKHLFAKPSNTDPTKIRVLPTHEKWFKSTILCSSNLETLKPLQEYRQLWVKILNFFEPIPSISVFFSSVAQLVRTERKTLGFWAIRNFSPVFSKISGEIGEFVWVVKTWCNQFFYCGIIVWWNFRKSNNWKKMVVCG